jgi:hypothetical protein
MCMSCIVTTVHANELLIDAQVSCVFNNLFIQITGAMS